MNAPPVVKANWLWPAVSAGAALLALMAILIDERVGSALGLRGLKPHFMDWVAILAAGDAHRAAADVYAMPNPFDPLGRPHSYGPWWLLIGDLGFTVEDRWWMGVLISGSFVVAAAVVLAPHTLVSTTLSVALLISPPVMLGLERANNDLLIVLMLVCAAWMLARWPRVGLWGAVGFVGLAAALKFYPFAALMGLPAARSSRRAILVAAAITIAGCAGVAWWYWSDYARSIAVVPKEITVFTYGFRVFAALAKDAFDQPWSIGLGIAGGIVLGIWLLGRQLGRLYRVVPLYGGTAFAYLAGSTSWVFCYLVNTNLSYRAVLLLLPARLWLREWNGIAFGVLARRCCALVLLLLWMACVTGNVYRWYERKQEAMASLLLMIVAFEQTLALMVTTALLVSLIGWGARHLKHLAPSTN